MLIVTRIYMLKYHFILVNLLLLGFSQIIALFDWWKLTFKCKICFLGVASSCTTFEVRSVHLLRSSILAYL
ncbi:uncharacterized protein OCT59_026557 [Rhizophagus irregularis]|uniref:uncharacterized protein n=1 Tax=Rhizophagus irregularis TaxID=588596 RepID=UPI0019FCC827|nr:hypothetical protein OCT59_026557 [Rhizophagus irregularis]GET50174.1 hypothetical protein RIR_jg32588.t1 [Rhizophagus irregularis DAOM 181602=DAOM 197198]